MRRSWKSARRPLAEARGKNEALKVLAKSQSDRTHRQFRREGCRLGRIVALCIPTGSVHSAAAGGEYLRRYGYLIGCLFKGYRFGLLAVP